MPVISGRIEVKMDPIELLKTLKPEPLTAEEMAKLSELVAKLVRERYHTN